MRPLVHLGMLALIVAACALFRSPASAATSCPGAVMGLRTVQCILAEKPDRPIHIVYIHGIRTSAPGFSRLFRKTMCKYMADGCPKVTRSRQYLDLGDRPLASYLGDEVWSEDEWKASRPFVEHFVYKSDNRPPIIIDEINYWPLLLAFKCKNLIHDDATLTGPDKDDIEICAGHATPPRHPWWRKPLPEPEGEPYLHAWIEPKDEAALLSTRPELGGSAWGNKLLKSSILTWGISDAVIALGPMKKYTRLAIWCAFMEIEIFDPKKPTDLSSSPLACYPEVIPPNDPDQQYVVISESLGSFVLLDAFATATYYSKRHDAASLPGAPSSPTGNASPVRTNPAGGVGSAQQFIVRRSDNIYFFANQFALLELARAEGGVEARSADPGAVSADTMRDWAAAPGASGDSKQLVAFNDPSDVLTYRVPDFCRDPRSKTTVCDAVIRNIPVKNSFNWFGLFERPDYAHTYYSRNPKVLSVIFGTQAPARRPR